MKHLLIASILVASAASAGAVETVKATVNGMVCAFCAQGIEKRLSRLPAAHEVFVDLKARVVAVEAKPGQHLDVQTVKREITEAGYDVVTLETLEQPLSQIKRQAKEAK